MWGLIYNCPYMERQFWDKRKALSNKGNTKIQLLRKVIVPQTT